MTKYFYAISITWAVAGTPHYGLMKGVADVGPNEGQESVFEYLLTKVSERYGLGNDQFALLHYYLARNEL